MNTVNIVDHVSELRYKRDFFLNEVGKKKEKCFSEVGFNGQNRGVLLHILISFKNFPKFDT